MTIKELLKDYPWNYKSLIEGINYILNEINTSTRIIKLLERYKDKELPISETIINDINNLYMGVDIAITYKGYFQQLNNILAELVEGELEEFEDENGDWHISFWDNLEISNHMCRVTDTLMIAENLLMKLDLPEKKDNAYQDRFYGLGDRF